MRNAVLGSPIAHSLSPVLHRTAYEVLGLSGWTYDAVEVDEAGLPAFVDGLDDTWRGLSLTMPLKRTVLPLLDSVSPVAEAAGAANTLLIGPAGRVGDNTDVPGAVAAIRERYDGPVGTAVVVGGGATAASLLLALADLGCERVTLLARDAGRAAQTVEVAVRRGAPNVVLEPLDGAPLVADVVCSTVPGGAQPPAFVDRVAGCPVVFEVVYDGWPTPLAAAAQADGRTLVSGLDLLLHQALGQVALMTDLSPETCAPALPAMRAAGESALSARAS